MFASTPGVEAKMKDPGILGGRVVHVGLNLVVQGLRRWGDCSFVWRGVPTGFHHGLHRSVFHLFVDGGTSMEWSPVTNFATTRLWSPEDPGRLAVARANGPRGGMVRGPRVPREGSDV